MHVDGKRYVVNGYPGADWVSNVRAADEVTLAQGRRTERVRMVELAPEEARPVLRAFPAAGADRRRLDEARRRRSPTGTPDEVEGLAGRLPGVSHRPDHVASLSCPTASASGRRGG